MKRNPEYWLLVTAILFCMPSFGQMENYQYKRVITNVSGQWNKVILPDGIFEKVRPDLADIRIYNQRDSIEVPYIFNDPDKQLVQKIYPFQLINESNNADGHYFTFDAHETPQVNEIELTFGKENFDWKIKLEGSQNLREWFTIADDYRLLSIRNDLTDFAFTKLVFPESKFRYFRILVKQSEDPLLETAVIKYYQDKEGVLNQYEVVLKETKENKRVKQSMVYLTIKDKVPVSSIKIFVNQNLEFYRPVTLFYLIDSVRVRDEWQHNYVTLSSEILQSGTDNLFKFRHALAQQFKIVIENTDNAPLNIDSVQVKGFQHALIARFPAPGNYFLVYGNKEAYRPDYDISKFEE